MRSEIDQLMEALSLDAIVVLGDKAANPYRDYLTKRANATGSIFKKRGEPAVFVLNSAMDAGEAARSELQIYDFYYFGRAELIEKHKNNTTLYMRDLFYNILKKLDIRGRVAVYGVADVQLMQRFAMVQELLPEITFVLETTLFDRLYTTKDDAELKELHLAATRASQIACEVRDLILQHRISGDLIVNEKGDALTIGAVKRFIRQREIDLLLDNPSGPIFAQGADAGTPHSHGNDSELIQPGKSIVFDYYPRLLESGYFHDLTRTWCIGFAPPEVQAAYDEVMKVFTTARDSMQVGGIAGHYQSVVCDTFEANGHPTYRTTPGTVDGYMHGLGHGLGLNIHEAPLFYDYLSEVLTPRNVFTIEPGLYYPGRGFGIRIEDTVYLDDSGTLCTLTQVPYDLILNLKSI